MELTTCNRRAFSLRLAGLFAGLGFASGAFAQTAASAGDEVSHAAEAIHQEVTFTASPGQVYMALTNSREFDKIVHLSAAGMSLGKKPVEIGREEGGTFALFGGYILGRHIELVPNERIVQAWRTSSWPPGVFSIARFQLQPEASNTRLVFDHTGFPAGQGEHLAQGWKANYWEPLQKYLALPPA